MSVSDKMVLAAFFGGVLANMAVVGTDLANWISLTAVAAAARLVQLGRVAPLTFLDKSVLAGAAMIAALPLASPGRLAAGAAALWVLVRQTDGRVRGAMVILAAILMRDPVAKAALDITSETILAWDATLAGGLMTAAGMEVVRNGNILTTASHELLVMSGCSSVTNMSWALLLWVAVTRTTVPAMQRRHWLAGAGVTAAVILVNGLRLALLGISAEFHQWAHGPDGTAVFEAATMLVAVALIFWSLRHDAQQHGFFSLVIGPLAGGRRVEGA